MKPDSLSVTILFPLAMTEIWRYLVCLPFQNYDLFFSKKMQVLRDLWFLKIVKTEKAYMLTIL